MTAPFPRWIRRKPGRFALASLLRWGTLLAFVLGTIGVPLDPLAWSGIPTGTCATNPGQTCRCSALSRMAGTCCCATGLKQAAWQPAARSCCAGKSKPATQPPERKDDPSVCRASALAATAQTTNQTTARACCQTRSRPPVISASLHEPTAGLEPDSTELVLQGCPCGSESADGLAICGEPRLLTRELSLPDWSNNADGYDVVNRLTCGQRGRPSTPPPKACLLPV
jgi:hypothetical protein